MDIDKTCVHSKSCGMDYCMIGLECPDYEKRQQTEEERLTWPWNEFPEDLSTWKSCVRRYKDLLKKLEEAGQRLELAEKRCEEYKQLIVGHCVNCGHRRQIFKPTPPEGKDKYYNGQCSHGIAMGKDCKECGRQFTIKSTPPTDDKDENNE